MLSSFSAASVPTEHEAVCTESFEEVTESVKRRPGLRDLASSSGNVPRCLVSDASCHAFDPYLLICHISWLDITMSWLHPSSNFLGIHNTCAIMSQIN